MGKLKEKSEFNIAAAELLIENNYYAPSVHCSYYSCFQLLKYVINNFFGIDYDTLSSKIAMSDKHTHTYVINYIGDEIDNMAGTIDSRWFLRTIKDLKQFREESDYDNIEINIDRGQLAYEKAIEIRKYLKNYFHV